MLDHMKRTKPIPAGVAALALESFYMELPESGCRPSTYPKDKGGYGRIKGYLAHRAAYTAINGPIPAGMVIDHKCGTRSCVNVEHLRVLTNGQNVQRHSGRDFPLDGGCGWGHPASEMKWFEYPSRPRRTCATCIKENNDIRSNMVAALYQLELAYGLGGHEGKRNYAYKMRLRAERIAAARQARRSNEAAS